MNLEKLVKTSLENFEPEVNPSVWQHIEQGLKNAPVSSDPNGSSAASSAGKTALKSVLNHINPWIWGAGIIAATAVATVLLFPSKEKNDAIQKTESTASTTVIPSTRQPAIENPEEKAETVISYNQPAAMELQNIQKSPGNSPVEENQAVEMVATNTEKKSPVEVADSKVQVEKTQTSSPSTVTSNSNAPASTDKNELSNIEAAPVIILNTQAGFAPLKVTALLNVLEKGTGTLAMARQHYLQIR